MGVVDDPLTVLVAVVVAVSDTVALVDLGAGVGDTVASAATPSGRRERK